jgi:hypothetical protein
LTTLRLGRDEEALKDDLPLSVTSVGNSALLGRPSAWKKKYAHRGVSELAAVAATGRREQLIEAAGDDLLLHKHLLSEALRKKPEARPRFGYLRIWVLLREGWSVIASASATCCRLDGLQLRMRVRMRKHIALHRWPAPILIGPLSAGAWISCMPSWPIGGRFGS